MPEDTRGGLTPACPATPEYRQYLFDITGGPRPDRAAQTPDDPAFDRFVRAPSGCGMAAQPGCFVLRK